MIRRRVGLVDRHAPLPLRIPGCQAWFDAANITGVANAGKVSTWPDATYYGRHATQATDASRPLWYASVAPNGLPGVYFAGGTYVDYTTLNLTDFTVFVVASIAALNMAAHYAVGGTTTGVFLGGAHASITGYGVTNATQAIEATTEPLGWRVMAACNNALSYNGAIPSSYSPNTPLTSFSVYRLGRRETAWADGYLAGYLSEVLIYDRLLPLYERQSIERYLGEKYNIGVI